MSLDLVGTNVLPNSYVEKIRIIEGEITTTIYVDIVAFDFKTEKKSVWYHHENFRKYMRIGAVLVNENHDLQSENSTISKINNGDAMLPFKDAVYKNISNHYAVEEYFDAEKLLYKYSLLIKIDGKLERNSFLYTFFSLNVEMVEKSLGIDLDSKTNKIITGTVSSEIIKSGGNMMNTTTLHYIENTEEIWTGPIHTHTTDAGNVVVMAGETHTSEPHPVLNPVEVENSKLLYYGQISIPKIKMDLFPIERRVERDRKFLNNLKQRNKKRNFGYFYEMQSSLDDEKNLHKIFIFDLCNMVLQKSAPAEILFHLNTELFMDIGNTLSLDNLSITRKKKGSPFESSIIDINNPQDVIPETEFYMDSRKKIYKNSNNSSHKKVSLIKQMQAGLPNQQVVLYMVDYQGGSLSTGIYSYTLDLILKDKYQEYIRGVLKDLQELYNGILYLRERYTIGGSFDSKSNSPKKSFLINYFQSFGITLNPDTGVPAGVDIDASGMREAFFIKGMQYLEKGGDVLGFDIDTVLFSNKINPITATPESLYIALEDVRKLIRAIEKTYRITYREFSEPAQANVGSKNSKTKLILKFSTILKDEKIVNNSDILYNFIKMPKANKTFKLSKRRLLSRANTEVNKYFNEKPQDVRKILKEIPRNMQTSIADIDTNKMLHFTPQSIMISNIEIDTSTINQKSSDVDLFKTILVSRELKNLDNDALAVFNLNLMNTPDAGEVTISADDIFGSDSPFINRTRRTLAYKPAVLLKNKRELNRVSSALFTSMKKIRSPRRTKSIALFNPEDKNNLFTDAIKKGKLSGEDIPIQIKSLLLSKSTSVKNNYIKDNNDIFNNHETSEVAHQHFGNIKKLKFIDKFPVMKNGLFNMSNPIVKDMTGKNYNEMNGVSKICFLDSLEDTTMGVEEEENEFNSVGSFFVLEDEQYKEPTTFEMQGTSRVNTSAHVRKVFNSTKKTTNLFTSTNKIKQNKKSGGFFKKSRTEKKNSSSGVVMPTTPEPKVVPLDEVENGLYPVGGVAQGNNTTSAPAGEGTPTTAPMTPSMTGGTSSGY